MEKTYKILKSVALLLILAVIGVGIWRITAPVPEDAPTEQEATAENANLAPDFTVYDAEGNPYKLSDFRGKPVILNFWASWCGPCKAEMPEFEAAFAEYGEDIHFIIVDLADGRSETVETGSAYIAEMGYTFPVYYDTDMDAAYTYQISSIPMTVFIDDEGVITGGQVGMISAEALEENIGSLLG